MGEVEKIGEGRRKDRVGEEERKREERKRQTRAAGKERRSQRCRSWRTRRNKKIRFPAI